MAKTISKPTTPKPTTPKSAPKSIPSHVKGGKIYENKNTGTGPRTPKK